MKIVRGLPTNDDVIASDARSLSDYLISKTPTKYRAGQGTMVDAKKSATRFFAHEIMGKLMG